MSKKKNRIAAAQGAAAITTSEVAPEITAPVAAEETAEVEKKETKVVSSKAKVAFLTPLIEEGKYSAKELAALALAQFPKMTESTINTFLTDAKNVKYNKFDKLVVLTADKKLAFAEETKAA